MYKCILVIDDKKDSVILEHIERVVTTEFNKDNSHQYNISVKYYDPTIVMDKEDSVEAMLNDLESEFLNGRLDLLLCDFNLSEDKKLLAYEIVVRVREKNKNCSIVMYTGNPFKDLVRLEHDGLAQFLADNVPVNEGKIEHKPVKSAIEGYIKKEIKDFTPLENAACSNIRKFITRKLDDISDTVLECLEEPSVSMAIENELLANESLIFASGNPQLDGASFNDVANEIRTGTRNGQKYQQQIIDSGLAIMIESNV